MRTVVVGTAGHIDHGKSALVRALTGVDPDRLKEEKARGITIDLGFAHAAIGDLVFSFVDVPGHERFVRNMLAGVGGIDLVVLVVAADESVMPQTREHFDICRLLQVPAGIVALTKSDLVDGEGLELAALEVRELVAGSFLDGAPIVPVSAQTGAGLDALRGALAAAAAAVAPRPATGIARLPIDRVFSMKGFGTVVTGTLTSGSIRVGDELAVVPGPRIVTARGVQVHGEGRSRAVAGERVALNLGGVDVQDLERGLTLTSPAALEATRVADVSLQLLPGVRPLKHGTRIRFHQGTAEVIGRVALIGSDGPPTGYARLRLEQPVAVTRGDRYILRAYSPPVTIAGGQVLDPAPPRIGVRRVAALERSRRLDPAAAGRSASELAAAALMIAEQGDAGLRLGALVSRAGIDPEQVSARADALAAAGQVRRFEERLVAAPVIERLKTALVALVTEHHRQNPLSEGVPREEARMRLFARGDAAVFNRVVDELAQSGALGGRERLALASHRVALSPEDARVSGAIEELIRTAGLRPPDPAGLAAQIGAPAATVARVLQILQRQKRLVKIESLLFHEEALRALKTQIAALKPAAAAQVTIDVTGFKERFGVTRKFAIPLLEYLDRERVTRRVGDARVIL